MCLHVVHPPMHGFVAPKKCSQSITLSGCSHYGDAGVECYNDTGIWYSLLIILLYVHIALHACHVHFIVCKKPFLILILASAFIILCTATRIPIRLVGGAKSTSFHSGRVELYINEQWGTVCDNSWSYNDARVVCRQLGYTSGTAYGRAIYGEGTGPIWLDYVRCRGYESSLLSCGHRGTGRHFCGHEEDASVACYNGGYSTSGLY